MLETARELHAEHARDRRERKEERREQVEPVPRTRDLLGVLDLLLGELRRLLPRATWTAAGIGRNQAPVMEWALKRGADAVRTGLEDNIRISRDRLAKSNAELVSLAAQAIERHGRRVATPAEARATLDLRAAA